MASTDVVPLEHTFLLMRPIEKSSSGKEYYQCMAVVNDVHVIFTAGREIIVVPRWIYASGAGIRRWQRQLVVDRNLRSWAFRYRFRKNAELEKARLGLENINFEEEALFVECGDAVPPDAHTAVCRQVGDPLRKNECKS